jgi:hypothetical protein
MLGAYFAELDEGLETYPDGITAGTEGKFFTLRSAGCGPVLEGI